MQLMLFSRLILKFAAALGNCCFVFCSTFVLSTTFYFVFFFSMLDMAFFFFWVILLLVNEDKESTTNLGAHEGKLIFLSD